MGVRLRAESTLIVGGSSILWRLKILASGQRAIEKLIS